MNEAINQESGEVLQISETTAADVYNRAVRIIRSLLPLEWFDSNGNFSSCKDVWIPVRILNALKVGLGEQTEAIDEFKASLWLYTKDDFAKILARYIFHTLFSESVSSEPLAKLELVHFAIAGRKDSREEYEKLNQFFGYLDD